MIAITASCDGKLGKWFKNDVINGQRVVSIINDSNGTTNVTSSCCGKIVEKLVQEGDHVHVGMVIGYIELCKHPAIFNQLCVVCGETVRNEEPSTENIMKHSTSSLTFTHGLQLQLSKEEAERVQNNKILSLRQQKKLALVLDLDHTLLHATPSPGNAKPSPSVLVNGVYHLPIEEVISHNPLLDMNQAIENNKSKIIIKHHIIKLRPHVEDFLAKANDMAQLSIYTAGTRKYAEAVVKILDPSGKYFGGRIVSRSDILPNEKGGIEKSLENIFLNDASMAIIIDDTENVWKGDQSSNLLLVKPFRYFQGLPEVNNNPGQSSSMINVGPIIKLLGDRSGAIHSSPDAVNSSDYDDQLLRCLELVKKIHSTFFTLIREPSSKNPSVGNIISKMKKEILHGCVITFSYLIPKNETNPETHPLWQLAVMLGAQVTLDVCARTTHLITTQTQTGKVLECVNRGNIWILHPDWLLYCRWSLSKAYESTFLLVSLPVEKPLPNPKLDPTPLTAEMIGLGNTKRSRSDSDAYDFSNGNDHVEKKRMKGVSYLCNDDSSSASGDSSDDESVDSQDQNNSNSINNKENSFAQPYSDESYDLYDDEDDANDAESTNSKDSSNELYMIKCDEIVDVGTEKSMDSDDDFDEFEKALLSRN